MKIFDGKKEALSLENSLVYLNTSFPNKSLGIVLLGDNLSSLKYVNLKISLCRKLSIKVELLHISATEYCSRPIEDSIHLISEFCRRSEISSVIIQLPVPAEFDGSVLELIPPDKDVDLLTSERQRVFYGGDFTFLSPVVLATKHFLEFYKFELAGSKVSLIGYGDLVGRPLESFFMHNSATTEVFDVYSNVRALEFESDLVVCAAGVPNLIEGSQIKPGAYVIDFGSSVVAGKVVGDFDSNSATSHLAALAPSPGGMGPLVIRYLLLNHLNNC